MAYKFHSGAYNTSGALNVESAITGNSLLVDTGGITVSAGASSVQQLTASALKVDNTILDGDILSGLAQVTASAMSASSAQFGSVTVTTLSAPNLDLTGYLIVSGNTTLGTDSADIVAVKAQLTASAGLSASAGTFATVIINGGGIDGAVIGGAVQASGKFTTLSSSAGLSVGGNALVGGALTANGSSTLNGAVTLNNGDTDLVKVSGSTTNDIFLVAADVDLLKVSKTNGVQAFGALSGSSTLQVGGVATVGGNLVVNGASTSTFANRVNLGQDGGSVSLSGSGQAQFGGGATIGGPVAANSGITNKNAAFSSINQKIVVRDAGDANDKAFMDGTGQISGSGNLNVGGAGVVAGNFTVSGTQTTVQQLTASFSTLGNAKVTALSSSGDVVVAGNLQVNGTTTYVNTTNMTVTDAKLVIATGSANAAAANGAGLYVGADDGGAGQYAAISYDGIGDLWNLTSVNGLDLATAGQVVKFEGTDVLKKTQLFGGAVTGSSAGVGLKISAAEKTAAYTMAVSDYVVAVDTATAAGPVTITLPASEVGRVYLIKDSGGSADTKNITVQRAGSDTIDGLTSVKLESPYAAVSIVCVATNKWSLF